METQKPQTADPLTWRRENEARFCGLKRLARKYLAIPATSAPFERVFSLAGNICSRRRASLSPDHLDALVFLNANEDLIRE
jgi:hAT family C-terminal dimerisation region